MMEDLIKEIEGIIEKVETETKGHYDMTDLATSIAESIVIDEEKVISLMPDNLNLQGKKAIAKALSQGDILKGVE